MHVKEPRLIITGRMPVPRSMDILPMEFIQMKQSTVWIAHLRFGMIHFVMTMKKPLSSVFLCLWLVVALMVTGCTHIGNVKTFTDVEYADVNGISLKLDIYVPENGDGPFPLLVWIHGGGFTTGDKKDCPLVGFCQKGYVVASIGYRFSNIAQLPAQVEDCKAAIRWLKAHHQEYGIDPSRVGVAGSSAGGYLANMLGVTGRNKKFDVGGNLDQTSEVQAVCNCFGPTDILTALDGLEPAAAKSLGKVYAAVLGGPISEKKALAIEMSPLTYVDEHAAPFMHVQGTADTLVPFAQAEKLHDKLRQRGVASRLFLIPRGGHGGHEFGSAKMIEELCLFFDENLQKKPEGTARKGD